MIRGSSAVQTGLATADSRCCFHRIEEHQLPEEGEQEIFAADDERSLWHHCSVVALFEPRHEVHRTLRDAQRILGAQVGCARRLQPLLRAEQIFRNWWPPSFAVPPFA